MNSRLLRKQFLAGLVWALVCLLLLGSVLAGPNQQQPPPDGAHTHPRYETQLAQHNAQFTQVYGTLAALTNVTAVPATATRTPTQGIPSTPTPEVASTDTPAPQITPTRTPTRTPVPTQPGTTPTATPNPSYYDDCVPDADFESFSDTLRRRTGKGTEFPVIMWDDPADGNSQLVPKYITTRENVLVCLKSLYTDALGFTWVQISTSQPEYFAIGRTQNGVLDAFGTLYRWGAATTPFSVDGNRLLLNGQQFKFTGVNFRELIGYDNVIMPYASPNDVVIQLDGAKQLGMSVVRFYVAHKSLSVEAAIPRVKRILDMLQARGMYAILVLTDGAYSGFEIRDNSTNRAFNGIDRYTHAFYEGGFRQNYLPYVEAMTAGIGAHPAILSWEIGNEFTTIQIPPTTAQMDAFLNFYAETAAVIRRNSPGKLISSGLESCWQLFVTQAYDGAKYCEKLYNIVEIGTIHTYQENTNQPLGTGWAHIVREFQIPNQVLIIEETNTYWENESTDWLSLLVKTAFVRVSGALHWNMCFTYARDIGTCDGAVNALVGTAQARRWFNITGFWKAFSEQLRLFY